MRLQAIKLAGFKSFVDPTNVSFPSNLCAVVGPNGCGKSNVIDAVRWVMGESSARNLRGESMTDVIFNGSNARKPVGQASVELLFDNSAGRLSGEYAAYNEVSIRRQVSRDGQSTYFLNNQRCRRKDITDVLLGTGLGPRSYSIIEQGMISDLIEAKPEELRAYLEEAAGISKYKERRRETERRISHTKDNLDRLGDLREELERQIGRLERQAKGAERYRGLKQQERKLKAELHGLRWKALTADIAKQDAELARLGTQREALNADHRSLDANIEAKRAELAELQDKMSDVQKRLYDHGTEIARIEEAIGHQNERGSQMDADLKQAIEDGEKVREDLRRDEAELNRMNAELANTQPRQGELQLASRESARALLEAEQAIRAWQREWDEFNHAASVTRQRAEVQQADIRHLEKAIEQGRARLVALEQELERLSGDTSQNEVAPLEGMQATQQAQLQRIESELGELNETIDRQRAENARTTVALDRSRGSLQELKGRHASLEALQQAALGQQDDAAVQWLERHGLGGQPRLAERLEVEEGWDVAVEMVLGSHLEAVCVDGLDAVSGFLGDFDQGHLNFIATGPATGSANGAVSGANTLASKMRGDAPMNALVQGVFVAESLAAALNMQPQLAAGESVVTREGVWVGKSWLRISRDYDAQAGVIKRQRELVDLAERIAELDVSAGKLQATLEAGMAALAQAEESRDAAQARRSAQQLSLGETQAMLSGTQVQVERVAADQERATREQAETQAQLQANDESLRSVRGELETTLDAMEADERKREALRQRQEEINAELDALRGKAKVDASAEHEVALAMETLRSGIASKNEAIERLRQQEQALAARRETLEREIQENMEPRDELQRTLDAELEARLKVEGEMNARRRESESMDQALRELDQQRNKAQEAVETVRTSLEVARMQRQEFEVRRNTIEEQLREDDENLDAVIEGLPEDASEESWEQALVTMGNRISRLGAINLAAIDEYRVQSERKQYLDAQNEDLEKALATLQNAIRKIDVETRTRFKETFDSVNARLQQLFPKLFGGGHAYMEMTGEDLLDTGVAIMARPPGKRNASIHLLSGGEKALTAIALVFSIFSLNPAPFCLLDEVDAPLDDANCVRYTELVKEMSRTVQFIFITHNKISMEMGDHLMGVTMQEAGVSRLVAVDVDEAVSMAAV